jgi:hypothetical protein
MARFATAGVPPGAAMARDRAGRTKPPSTKIELILILIEIVTNCKNTVESFWLEFG